MGRTKAERKLGWGGADTVHFLFKSLYLLSHPSAKLSERARLSVCAQQIPASQGFED